MGKALPFIKGAATLLSAGGQRQEGEAAQAAKEFEAKTAYASGTRRARMASKEGDITASRARAVMAAGGGGVDPEQIAKIESAADYNVLSALYEGGQEADIARYEGRIKRHAAKKKSLGTLLSGGAKTYESFKKQGYFS